MKVTYDPEVDVLRIVLRDTPVEESGEDKPGVILDASIRVNNPRAVDYVVTA